MTTYYQATYVHDDTTITSDVIRVETDVTTPEGGGWHDVDEMMRWAIALATPDEVLESGALGYTWTNISGMGAVQVEQFDRHPGGAQMSSRDLAYACEE